jgi:hypothetical protein
MDDGHSRISFHGETDLSNVRVHEKVRVPGLLVNSTRVLFSKATPLSERILSPVSAQESFMEGIIIMALLLFNLSFATLLLNLSRCPCNLNLLSVGSEVMLLIFLHQDNEHNHALIHGGDIPSQTEQVRSNEPELEIQLSEDYPASQSHQISQA